MRRVDSSEQRAGVGAGGAVGGGTALGVSLEREQPFRIALHRTSGAASNEMPQGAPRPPVNLLCAASALRDHGRSRPAGLPRIQLTDEALGAPPATDDAAATFSPDAVVLAMPPGDSPAQRGHDSDAEGGFKPPLGPLRDAGMRHRKQSASTPRIAWIDEDRAAAARLLEEGAADLVVRGEAEALLPEILERAIMAAREDGAGQLSWAGYRGVSWRDGETIRHEREIPGPTRMPSPAWDLVDLSQYSRAHPLAGSRKSGSTRSWLSNWAGRSGARATILTARACPPDCPTCHGSFGSHGRERSVSEVLSEIRELVQKHRVRDLAIGDHAFDGQPARALAIVQGIAKLRSAPGCGRLRLSFPKGLRGDGLTPELIDALLSAGAAVIPLRVTTASPRLQRLLKENIDLAKVARALGDIAARGGRGHLLLRLGLPTETVGELAHTIRWARASRAVTADFGSGRHVDLGPSWTKENEGDIDDFPTLRRRALTSFYSSPSRAGRLARTFSTSLAHAIQRATP